MTYVNGERAEEDHKALAGTKLERIDPLTNVAVEGCPVAGCSCSER